MTRGPDDEETHCGGSAFLAEPGRILATLKIILTSGGYGSGEPSDPFKCHYSGAKTKRGPWVLPEGQCAKQAGRAEWSLILQVIWRKGQRAPNPVLRENHTDPATVNGPGNARFGYGPMETGHPVGLKAASCWRTKAIIVQATRTRSRCKMVPSLWTDRNCRPGWTWEKIPFRLRLFA